MKLENKIVIAVLFIGLLVSIFILYIKLIPYKEESELTKNPFSTIKILNQEIDLQSNTRLYTNTIDCTNLEVNEQILSYNLKEDYENYKIKASIKVFKDNELLKDDYDEATNIETEIIVNDENKLYEQIFIIKSTCQ